MSNVSGGENSLQLLEKGGLEAVHTAAKRIFSPLKGVDDVPVGAVAMSAGEIVGRGTASDNLLGAHHAHAEMMALENARLSGANINEIDTIVCTMESCLACLARLSKIPAITTLASITSRKYFEDKNLVHKRPSIHEVPHRFDTITLSDPLLQALGSALPDNVEERNLETGWVKIDRAGLEHTLIELGYGYFASSEHSA
jgi:tRNA(Arg) A34 adenosine deaminase TadA